MTTESDDRAAKGVAASTRADLPPGWLSTRAPHLIVAGATLAVVLSAILSILATKALETLDKAEHDLAQTKAILEERRTELEKAAGAVEGLKESAEKAERRLQELQEQTNKTVIDLNKKLADLHETEDRHLAFQAKIEGLVSRHDVTQAAVEDSLKLLSDARRRSLSDADLRRILLRHARNWIERDFSTAQYLHKAAYRIGSPSITTDERVEGARLAIWTSSSSLLPCHALKRRVAIEVSDWTEEPQMRILSLLAPRCSATNEERWLLRRAVWQESLASLSAIPASERTLSWFEVTAQANFLIGVMSFIPTDAGGDPYIQAFISAMKGALQLASLPSERSRVSDQIIEYAKRISRRTEGLPQGRPPYRRLHCAARDTFLLALSNSDCRAQNWCSKSLTECTE